jgi:hypothetical protein
MAKTFLRVEGEPTWLNVWLHKSSHLAYCHRFSHNITSRLALTLQLHVLMRTTAEQMSNRCTALKQTLKKF